VIADCFERPTLDQLAGLGFEAVPKIPDEVEEATATRLLAPKPFEVSLDLDDPDVLRPSPVPSQGRGVHYYDRWS
jgi:hypothetical protein